MSSTFKRSRKVVPVIGATTTATNTDAETNTDGSTRSSINDKSQSDNNESPLTTSTTTTTGNSTTGSSVSQQHYVAPMRGTKFWTHGIVLTSTGLRELDNILLSSSGSNRNSNTASNSSSNSSSVSSSSSSSIGGQPMGTCICLENNDTFLSWSSPLSNCIVRYWCAEGISQEQTLIIPVFNERDVRSDHDLLGEISSWTTDNNDSFIASDITPKPSTTNTIQELLDSLPRNNNMDIQERTKQLKSTGDGDGNVSATTNYNVPLETLIEGGDDENDDDDEYYDENNNDYEATTNNNSNAGQLIDTDEGLVVAWQYRKDVQQERLGLTYPHQRSNKNSTTTNIVDKNRIPGHGTTSTVYCHSYNLQGRLKDQIDIEPYVRIVPINTIDKNNNIIGCSSNSRITDGMKFYQRLISVITTPTKLRTVIRLLLYFPDMSLCSFALPLLLHHIRTYKLPVIVLVIPRHSDTATTRSDLYNIRRCSDVVLSTENFTLRDNNSYPPPTEFRNLHGLLHILRLSTMTQMSTVGHFADRTIQRSPISIRYGLYRDRRKLHISLLHIPPEDYTTDGGSVTNGAVRSGAGRRTNATTATGGCSSSGGDGKGPFDF